MIGKGLISKPLSLNLGISSLGDMPRKESLENKKTEKDPISQYENKLISASSEQNEVKEKIDKYLESLEEKYDAFLDKLLNESYKDHSAYNDIVSGYTDLGEKMAYNASASAASSNSGNYDTLGAANAHRQMISYKNAGENAARDAYNESISAYADSLKDYASNAGDAYSLLSQSADRKDDFTLSLIDDYANYRKTYDDMFEQLKENFADKEASDNSDDEGLAERVDSYISMLMTVYPQYAEELERLFYPSNND